MTRSMLDPDVGFRPPRRRVGRFLFIGAGLVAAALIATALVWLPPRVSCGLGSGLVERGGECVGVTDGAPAFLPGSGELEADFRRVQELIKKENDWVVKQMADKEVAVKMALVAPLTPTDKSPLVPEQILRAMQGAYVAQKRANRTTDFSDKTPLIQLHLANTGSRQKEWKPVVDELASMTDDAAPLVAMVGGGISSQDTKDAAKELSKHGIPMFASVASATDLNSADDISGLVRVSPSNADYVAALKRYVGAREELDTVILVHDDREPDLHVTSLTEAFTTQFGAELENQHPQGYEGKTDSDQGPESLFDKIVGNICTSGANTVLFSGRGVDLKSFLELLKGRACQSDPFSVLFVETGPVMTDEEEKKLAEKRITLVHASATDPDWGPDAPEAAEVPTGFDEFYARFEEYLGEELEKEKGGAGDVHSALRNGYAIAHHDALMTAVEALRLNNDDAREEPLTADDVKRAQFLLNNGNMVKAASGTLVFSSTRNGDPGDKPVPVIELGAKGKERQDGLYFTPAL